MDYLKASPDFTPISLNISGAGQNPVMDNCSRFLDPKSWEIKRYPC